MSDDVDIATERIENLITVRTIMDAKDLPTGMAGECDKCGEPHPRLVDGVCVPCREKANKFRIINGK